MNADSSPAPGAALGVRTDQSGTPRLSATFVLRASPTPEQRLRDLVNQASVAVELEARVDRGTVSPPCQLTGVTFEVLGTSSRVDCPGPFGHGALSLVLTGSDAADLLGDLVAGSGGPKVRATLSLAAETAAKTMRLMVDLGALWRVLNAHASANRRFARQVLLGHVGDLMTAGAVTLDPPAADQAVRTAVFDRMLVAVRSFLRPVDGTDLLELSPHPPGDQRVEFTMPAPSGSSHTVVLERPLADLMSAAIGTDTERYVHLVTVSGGQVQGVLPARRVGRARGGDPRRFMLARTDDGTVEDVAIAVRPVPEHPILTVPQYTTASSPVYHSYPLEQRYEDPEPHPGPVIGEAGLWPDRTDPATHWYLPTFTLMAPLAGVDADVSPFHFDLVTQGHAADGSEGLEASITLTLVSGLDAATQAAADALGGPPITPVPLSSIQLQLGIPFRDQNGATQVEGVPASTLSTTGPLGAAGSTVTAVFMLRDQWARLAYGALSVVGFQAEPVRVQVAAAYEGWRGRGPGPWYLMADKRMSVAREAGVTSRALARTQLQALAKASISVVAPLDYVRPEIVGLVIADFYAWIQATANQAVEVLVPCADFGNLYRRQRDGLWADLGCQPALRLGDTDYLTFEPVDVVAAQGWATVLRSLTQPGRYLVVPRRHCVGRYGEHDGERAFRPALLLHSSIDADNPANIRCVLAASLEPDLPPSRRTAIEVELRRLAGREITTLMPWDVGVMPQITWAAPGSADLECVAVDRGFTVVLSTDIPGFLVLKTLLEHGGLMGSASYAFPGGVGAATTLKLGLDSVTGPYDTGPVVVDGPAPNAR